MFRRLLVALCMIFGITVARAGPAANVEYVHQMIAHIWGIEVPYNPELKNPRFVANMKYLMTAVDVANRILNDVHTTDYSNSEYATTFAADTIATNAAVMNLVRPIEYHFTATTTADTSQFSFKISAAGTFYVDWGDGTIEKIERATAGTEDVYDHTYETAGVYDIRLGGKATGYNGQPAISFAANTVLGQIQGSLGKVFSNNIV